MPNRSYSVRLPFSLPTRKENLPECTFSEHSFHLNVKKSHLSLSPSEELVISQLKKLSICIFINLGIYCLYILVVKISILNETRSEMASPCLTPVITTYELLNPHAMLLTVNCVLILTLSEEAESYISPKHAEMLHSTCTLLNSQTRFPQCHTRTPSLPAYMHIQWTICLISNISGHYGSYSSRSGWYTHEQGKKKGGGGLFKEHSRVF